MFHIQITCPILTDKILMGSHKTGHIEEIVHTHISYGPGRSLGVPARVKHPTPA